MRLDGNLVERMLQHVGDRALQCGIRGQASNGPIDDGIRPRTKSQACHVQEDSVALLHYPRVMYHKAAWQNSKILVHFVLVVLKDEFEANYIEAHTGRQDVVLDIQKVEERRIVLDAHG